MNRTQATVAFVSGLVFAIGLGVSGMTQPQKVIGFLDIFGRWDPSLAMVMIGAITVHGLSQLWIRRRPSPLLAKNFERPATQSIDFKLAIGASLFGLGWGMAGFCPGPALTSLASGESKSFLFVAAMLAGMALYRWSAHHFFSEAK